MIRFSSLQRVCFSPKFIDAELITLLPPDEGSDLTVTVVHHGFDDDSAAVGVSVFE